MAFDVPDGSLEQIITIFPNIGAKSCLTVMCTVTGSAPKQGQGVCCDVQDVREASAGRNAYKLFRKKTAENTIDVNRDCSYLLKRVKEDPISTLPSSYDVASRIALDNLDWGGAPRFSNTLFFHGNAVGIRIFGLTFNLDEILQDLITDSNHGAANRAAFLSGTCFPNGVTGWSKQAEELLKRVFHDGPKCGVCGEDGHENTGGDIVCPGRVPGVLSPSRI
ncbi:unnamed protein product [Acanthocheilonema viteae]|uniref:Uncharacterized protein n=1 Tax=Acanthocheilonema viteae TaxID=6277 RepID=A0A498SDL0_ACAVI|nr:unnamed protein product [Acanthocheilonema viteae]